MAKRIDEGERLIQQYLQKYWFPPSIFAGFEPFVRPFLRDSTVGGYNIAKSAYQTRTNVFNLAYLAKTVGKNQEEVERRLKKMIDEHTIMLVQDPNCYVTGWGIYAFFLKLRDGFTAEEKEEVVNHIQNSDEFCTTSVAKGDFDFFGANHIGVLDYMVNTIMKPLEAFPQVATSNICPVARYVREEKVAGWRAPKGTTREFFMTDEEIARLRKVQNHWDETDIKIFCALNKKKPVEDLFNFSALGEFSGLNGEELKKNMKSYVEEFPIFIPMIWPNWMKLGLTKHFFVVRLYRQLPTEDKCAIVDKLAENPAWELLWQFTQSPYDIIMSVYNELDDVDVLRVGIRAIQGVEEIKEFDVYRATRRWACRLDEQAGYWENCVMTNDIGYDSADPVERELYPYYRFGEFNLK